jgi:hypothetical protein
VDPHEWSDLRFASRLRLWCGVLGVSLLTGCVLMPRAVEYVRGNVRSAGMQEHLFVAAEYSSVWIGTPREPFAGQPVVTLRFPDGTSVRSDRLDLAWLRRSADRTAPRRASSLLAEEGWPAGAEELAVGSWRFIAQTDRVVGFGFGPLDSHQMPAPEIGDPEGRAFHRPPLRESTLVALFGPPDRIRKWTPK